MGPAMPTPPMPSLRFTVDPRHRCREKILAEDRLLPVPKNVSEALALAAKLTPTFGARALEAERDCRVPAESLSELHAAALFRLLQPARIGGAELDIGALVEVSAELARGCASTAWVFANLASHHWMLGMWPPSAQDEVWGDDPDALVGAALIFPSGRATRVAGGYQLSGTWGYTSGIDACQWVILGAIVADAGDGTDAFANTPGEYRLFLLPKSDYQIHDTWQVVGLAGSGSNEIAVAAALVPVHRTLALADASGGATPGSVVNPGPLYRIPLLPTFGYVVAGVALGIAQGALDLFAVENRQRLASYSGRMLTDYASVQARVAEAGACVDAARRVLLANCADIMADAACNKPPSLLEKARLRRDAAFAAQLARRAVDLLFDASGGAVLFLVHPAQRAMRDIRAACAHIALNWDAAASLYGRVALGHSADLPPYER
jgi:3-hydroxy-9,10-secoandrosta-1,3,5(10)-triene-9,17-dione monooxygenase